MLVRVFCSRSFHLARQQAGAMHLPLLSLATCNSATGSFQELLAYLGPNNSRASRRVVNMYVAHAVARQFETVRSLRSRARCK